MNGPPNLETALGSRLRALRDAHGVTADTVAAHARRLGLSWQRSTVGTIEAGRRRLSGDELLLLPLLLSMALPVTISLRDLLDVDIALTPELVMTPTGFQQLLDEKTSLYGGYRLTSGSGARREIAEKGSGADDWRRIEQLWPDVNRGARLDLARMRAVQRAAGGEAEQKASRTLQCRPLEVSAVAHRLWGHGLTEERDLRMRAADSHDETPAALRVRRGHVTRILLQELGEALHDVAAEAAPQP